MPYPLTSQLILEIPAAGMALQPSVTLPANTAAGGMIVPYVATVPLLIGTAAMGAGPGEQALINSASFQVCCQVQNAGIPSAAALSLGVALNSPFGTVVSSEMACVYFNNTVSADPWFAFQGFVNLSSPAPLNVSEFNTLQVSASVSFPVPQIPASGSPGVGIPAVVLLLSNPYPPETGPLGPQGSYCILSGSVYQQGEPR